MWVNLFIVSLQLAAAFPMDGGRVLRSLLALRMERSRAIKIAANIGQAMPSCSGSSDFPHPLTHLHRDHGLYLARRRGFAGANVLRSSGFACRDAMMTPVSNAFRG